MAENTSAAQPHAVALILHHDDDGASLDWASSDDVPGKFSLWSYPCNADGVRDDHWGSYTYENYAFSDPNVAFEFKMRFG